MTGRQKTRHGLSKARVKYQRRIREVLETWKHAPTLQSHDGLEEGTAQTSQAFKAPVLLKERFKTTKTKP